MAKPGIPIDLPFTVTRSRQGDTTNISPITGYTSDLDLFTFQLSNANAFQYEKDDITWNMGDGHIKKGLAVEHSWDVPGVYDISISITTNGKLFESTTQASISSFYNDQLVLSTNVSSVTASKPSNMNLKYVLPQHIAKALPRDHTTVNLYCSGSLSNPIFPEQYIENRYDHFKCMWYFVSGAGALATDTFNIPHTKLYAKYNNVNSTYVAANSSDPGAKLVGVSGQKDILFTDNTNTSNNVNIFASVDQSQYSALNSNGAGTAGASTDIGLLQTKTSMLPISVVPNVPTHLVFSTIGLPGFDIGKIKKQNSPIYYYISLADNDGNIIRCPYNQLTSKCLPASATAPDTFYNVTQSIINNTATSYYYTTAADMFLPGSFPGAVTLANSGTNVQLSASVVIPLTGGRGDSSSASVTLTGVSNTFNVILSTGDNYNIFKSAEDYDAHQTLKSYISQPNINDSVFFTEVFLKNVFGDNLAEPTDLGKLIYEKIENYTNNHSDIDTCNIDSIYSHADQYGLDLRDYRYTYPSAVNRLANLLSISFDKLFGYSDDTIYNFNNEGYTTGSPSWDHARNLGDKIDTNTYQVTAGTPIVVKELFNKSCKYVMPMILSAGDASSLSSYPLTSYNSEWGWGLTYPTGTEFSDFYDFYEYRDNTYFVDSSLRKYNSVIDWENDQTTISKNTTYNDWIKDDTGVIEILYLLQLLKGFDVGNKNPGYDITLHSNYSTCSGEEAIPTTTTTTTTPEPTVTLRRDPNLNINIDTLTQDACD